MTLSNSDLVPEFQHYFHDFVISSKVNKYQIPVPVDINEILLTKGSVVELLCSETFPYDSYTYLYKAIDRQSWPMSVRQRLMIYASSKYLVPGEGDNIFNLQNDDLSMLDVLLRYRHDSTSVTVIDTTSSVITIIDSTSNIIISGNIDALNTPLSKLIFLYLDLHLNNNYLSYFQLSSIISDCSILATCFELKLIDDYFNFISNRDMSFRIVCT